MRLASSSALILASFAAHNMASERTTMRLEPATRRPILVAHRGDSLSHPENTEASVLAALSAGADWVEIDVQVTADGVPVLLHD